MTAFPGFWSEGWCPRSQGKSSRLQGLPGFDLLHFFSEDCAEIASGSRILSFCRVHKVRRGLCKRSLHKVSMQDLFAKSLLEISTQSLLAISVWNWSATCHEIIAPKETLRRTWGIFVPPCKAARSGDLRNCVWSCFRYVWHSHPIVGAHNLDPKTEWYAGKNSKIVGLSDLYFGPMSGLDVQSGLVSLQFTSRWGKNFKVSHHYFGGSPMVITDTLWCHQTWLENPSHRSFSQL